MGSTKSLMIGTIGHVGRSSLTLIDPWKLRVEVNERDKRQDQAIGMFQPVLLEALLHI